MMKVLVAVLTMFVVLGCGSSEVRLTVDEEQQRQAEEQFQNLSPEQQEQMRQMQQQQEDYRDRFFNPPRLETDAE